jgi:hypothetical protein
MRNNLIKILQIKVILNHPLREIHQKKQLFEDKIETQFCIIGSLVNIWKG